MHWVANLVQSNKLAPRASAKQVQSTRTKWYVTVLCYVRSKVANLNLLLARNKQSKGWGPQLRQAWATFYHVVICFGTHVLLGFKQIASWYPPEFIALLIAC